MSVHASSSEDEFVAMSNVIGAVAAVSDTGDQKRRKVDVLESDETQEDDSMSSPLPVFTSEIDEATCKATKMLTGREIISRIAALAAEHPDRNIDGAIIEFAVRTMTVPLQLGGKNVAGPVQLVRESTVIKVGTNKKRERVLIVEYLQDEKDKTSYVTADYIAVGGVCDTKRGYIQRVNEGGSSLEAMLGCEANPGNIRSMKGKLKPLNSSVFYYFIDETTPSVMGATEIYALVHANFTAREELSDKEHAILVKYATHIIEVSSAAVERLHAAMVGEFPQVREHGPFLSTSKGIETFTGKHKLPRTSVSCNQSTVLWTPKPAQFFATGIYSSVDPSTIANMTDRLANFSKRENVYPVVRPPIVKMGMAPFTEHIWNPRFKLFLGYSLLTMKLTSYPGASNPSEIFTSMSTYFTIGLHGVFVTSEQSTTSSYMPTSFL